MVKAYRDFVSKELTVTKMSANSRFKSHLFRS